MATYSEGSEGGNKRSSRFLLLVWRFWAYEDNLWLFRRRCSRYAADRNHRATYRKYEVLPNLLTTEISARDRKLLTVVKPAWIAARRYALAKHVLILRRCRMYCMSSVFRRLWQLGGTGSERTVFQLIHVSPECRLRFYRLVYPVRTIQGDTGWVLVSSFLRKSPILFVIVRFHPFWRCSLLLPALECSHPVLHCPFRPLVVLTWHLLLVV